MSNLWEETVDPNTGKSSIEYHESKVVQVWCKPEDHYFEYIPGGSREIKCKNCGHIATFILGLHTIIDGKLTTTK